MDASALLVLALAGAVGGVLVGLVGVGGGIVYAPALFFVLRAQGISDPELTPLVLGSSLLCVGVAAISGTIAQHRRGNVHVRAALVSGSAASATVAIVGRAVTSQPWYDGRVFSAVFATVLLLVAGQMVWPRKSTLDVENGAVPVRDTTGRLVGGGLVAGALSALAGVGGGIVLVPVYNTLVRLPLRMSVGTSGAAIVLVAAAGVVTYAVLGWGADVPPGAVGYVSLFHSAALVAPAVVTARWGVVLAHRVSVRSVRIGFAAFAALTAGRLLWEALGAS